MNQIVMTTNGPVEGELRNGVFVFHGIPYGADCEGENRFLPPKKPAPWTEVRKCLKNGPIAMQDGSSIGAPGSPLSDYFTAGNPEKFGVVGEVQSENCLVINVNTPGLDDRKRPVLVYIHGGGFSAGSGALTVGTDEFETENDIVLVGVNHRLNIFGYLYLGDLDDAYRSSGLAGMLDLVLALEWIRDNIGAFGGDPEQVTIMGESGGGMKVATLLCMTNTKGLFSRAIIESGSAKIGTITREAAAKDTEALLDFLKIDKKDWKKLLEVPADKLLEFTRKYPMQMGAIPDEIYLLTNREDSYALPEWTKDIPIMIGSSMDEMAIFFPEPMLRAGALNLKQTLMDPPKMMDMEVMPKVPADKVDEVIAVLREGEEPGVKNEHLLVKALSQSNMLGAGAFFQMMANASKDSRNRYYYLVTFDTPVPAKGREKEKYAWHTADLPLQLRVVLYKESEPLSLAMSKAWAAFVKTGNPSTDSLNWDPFNTETKLAMVFDKESKMVSDPAGNIRRAFGMDL